MRRVPILRRPDKVPESEFCDFFIQGMYNRMATSYFKYGKVADAYPEKVDAIASLHLRLERYVETGNREYLMDVANFAMIEFMHPRHPQAHLDPMGSSPGRTKTDGVVSTKHNLDLK